VSYLNPKRLPDLRPISVIAERGAGLKTGADIAEHFRIDVRGEQRAVGCLVLRPVDA
jgi:hypothetical protein